jgi:hypothetical protein
VVCTADLTERWDGRLLRDPRHRRGIWAEP